MTDYHLRASDATALYDVLEAAGVVTEGDHGWHVTDAHKYALDVIGEIAETNGFHANLRVIDASSFSEKKIATIIINTPSNPVRGWA